MTEFKPGEYLMETYEEKDTVVLQVIDQDGYPFGKIICWLSEFHYTSGKDTILVQAASDGRPVRWAYRPLSEEEVLIYKIGAS
jgi:hypothetical protein